MRIIIIRCLTIAVFNKIFNYIITIASIYNNIYVIKINTKVNYSKAFNEIIIQIIFIKLFKFRFSIFNKFKSTLILKLKNIFIYIKIIKLYLIKLFKIIINYENIINY